MFVFGGSMSVMGVTFLSPSCQSEQVAYPQAAFSTSCAFSRCATIVPMPLTWSLVMLSPMQQKQRMFMGLSSLVERRVVQS